MIKEFGLRNSRLLSIAPTGSISNILGVSGGVEPYFYVRISKELSNQCLKMKKAIWVYEKTPLRMIKHFKYEKSYRVAKWASNYISKY